MSHRTSGALFERGVLTAPQMIEISNAHAIRLISENRFEAAIAYCDHALALMPDHTASHWNKGLALLALGAYRQGFKEFEHRLKWKLDGDAKLPHWRGEDLRDKSLLWYQEHGFGDAIMMLRFIPRLQQMGAKVTALVSPEMTRLFDVPTLTKWSGEQFDFKLAMFSVMERLNVGLADIPNAPYLIPDEELVRKWRARLPSDDKRRVGIAWSGRRTNALDRSRSIELPEFLSLLGVGDCDVYSVQNCEHELARSCGVAAHHFEDFADTLAFMACMDTIVTVATASSMLAGAMGHRDAHAVVPYHPDWRFWHSYAWFPTLKTHRQRQPGEWREVFNGVRRAFDPSQPRDEDGKWTDAGGSDDGGASVTVAGLKQLRPDITKAAQEEYDAWEQDEDGVDEELGTGGICDRITQRMGSILADAGIETADAGQPGDEHAWLYANLKEGVYEVDIPPNVYETGGSYKWTKKPNVTFQEDDIVISKLDEPMSDEEFRRKYGDE